MDQQHILNMYQRLHHNAPIALAPPSSPLLSHKDATAGTLFLQQQRTLEIIQLVEVEAPPPRQLASDFVSSSASSSSSDSEACESSEPGSEEDPESESTCSSYCSSDEEEMKARKISFYDDTYGTRLNRVLAWRESFAKAMGITSPRDDSSHTSFTALQKRKVDYDEDVFDDTSSSSHSSKRSRSTSPEPRHRVTSWVQRRLSAHSCPACDESFTTRQHLQQHGQDPRLSDACRIAVQYGLEP